MDRIQFFSERSPHTVSSEVVDDLHRVAARLDDLEVRLSVLSVQMQYDTCRFEQRTEQLTQELGDINELLESLLLSGN